MPVAKPMDIQRFLNNGTNGHPSVERLGRILKNHLYGFAKIFPPLDVIGSVIFEMDLASCRSH
jgi:hypothetical protein